MTSGRPLRQRYDVVVGGSGPAGSVAALELARAGARVLMVDPDRFPRNKACGDVIGPSGIAVLADLRALPPGARPAGDVVLVGPDWRGVRLPWPQTVDGCRAMVVQRSTLDACLREAALRAGAEPWRARVTGLAQGPGDVDVVLGDAKRVCGSFLVGADGALSRVATASELLRPERALWGFALRAYGPARVAAPHIILWAPNGGPPLPGYGWVFPAGCGRANVGLGVAVGAERGHAALASRLFGAFVTALEDRGILDRPAELRERRGGWLRMGLSGCVPASGRVLLVGDAAGLVNPLQGEGIAEAVTSGRAAARAILEQPSAAAAGYRRSLHAGFGGFQSRAGALHSAIIARPRLRTLAARGLTVPPAARVLAPGWAVWWNDLLDASTAGPQKASAVAIGAGSSVATLPARRRHDVLRALNRPSTSP